MTDQGKASLLAKEAFEQWQAGRHEQSRLLYEEAIVLADPQHWALSAYHGELACVLNLLGRHEQATAQLEKSLAAELAQGNKEGSPAVAIARYFLAGQLLNHGAPERALEILQPSINLVPDDWPTRLAEAHILSALGRHKEAKMAAALAISNAPTATKAEELRQDLGLVLSALDGPPRTFLDI